MMQKLNPELNADSMKQLELQDLLNNQGDQFSFNSNMNGKDLEPITAMRQFSFQPGKQDEAMQIQK